MSEALKDVAGYITEHRITEAVHLIDRTLRRSGLSRPRLSVAALNPHAGDNGNFGMEEIEAIREDYIEAFGEPSPPSQLYDRLLRIGSIPPALVREELLQGR